MLLKPGIFITDSKYTNSGEEIVGYVKKQIGNNKFKVVWCDGKIEIVDQCNDFYQYP